MTLTADCVSLLPTTHTVLAENLNLAGEQEFDQLGLHSLVCSPQCQDD